MAKTPLVRAVDRRRAGAQPVERGPGVGTGQQRLADEGLDDLDPGIEPPCRGRLRSVACLAMLQIRFGDEKGLEELVEALMGDGVQPQPPQIARPKKGHT